MHKIRMQETRGEKQNRFGGGGKGPFCNKTKCKSADKTISYKLYSGSLDSAITHNNISCHVKEKKLFPFQARKNDLGNMFYFQDALVRFEGF